MLQFHNWNPVPTNRTLCTGDTAPRQILEPSLDTILTAAETHRQGHRSVPVSRRASAQKKKKRNFRAEFYDLTARLSFDHAQYVKNQRKIQDPPRTELNLEERLSACKL